MEMASFFIKIRHFFGDTSLTERSIGAGPPVIIQLSGYVQSDPMHASNTPIVSKSEAESHRPPPDSGAPLCIDLYYSVVVFRVFCLGYASDRASFTITKIEAYKKNFLSIMALQRRETGFTTLKEWRASDRSSFCYFHTKSTQNI